MEFIKLCATATSLKLEGGVLKICKGDETLKEIDFPKEISDKTVEIVFDKFSDIVSDTIVKYIPSEVGDGVASVIKVKATAEEKIKNMIELFETANKIHNYKDAYDIELSDFSKIIGAFGLVTGPLKIYIDKQLEIGDKIISTYKGAFVERYTKVLAASIESGDGKEIYGKLLEQLARNQKMTPQEVLLLLYQEGLIELENLKEALKSNSATAAQAKFDPVVLDLNGNGTMLTPIENGVNFDLNGDGFSEKTEWIESGDGFLVRDLNNNGTIDNGQELIGDGMLLSDGAISKNGLDVLKDMDKNKDGVLDSNDLEFLDLKVWIDSDNDGITDIGELKSLSELGIEKFVLNSSIKNRIEIGKVTKNDGTEVLLGDLFFEVDYINTVEKDAIDNSNLQDDIKVLPQIEASGTVANLRKAMSVNESLKDLVKRFCESPKVENIALIDEILFKWCGTENIETNSRGYYIDARVLGVIEKFIGKSFVGADGANPNKTAANTLDRMYNNIKNYVLKKLELQSYLSEYALLIDTKFSFVSGEFYYDFNRLEQYINNEKDYSKLAMIFKGLNNYYSDNNEICSKLKNLIDGLKGSNEYFTRIYNIKNYVKSDLMGLEIRGDSKNDYVMGNVNNNKLYGGSGNDILDGAEGDDYLDGGSGDDTYIFGKGYGKDRINNGSSGHYELDILKLKDISLEEVEIEKEGEDLLITVKGTEDSVRIEKYFNQGLYLIERIEFADGTCMEYKNVYEYLKNAARKEYGTENNDILNKSNEWIGYKLYGKLGDDELYGGSGNDILDGGEGNDKLYGKSGHDILDGGVGDDYLEGGAGNDTYIFGKGYGQDIINNNSSLSGDIDILKLKDIKFDEAEIIQSGSNLIIKVRGAEDSITVQSYFSGGGYSLENIEFSDGKSFTMPELKKYLLEVGIQIDGNNESETLDYSSNWAKLNINAGTGNDVVYGGTGNDELYGNSGNDKIYGKSGHDILDGGVGDDYLDGGKGNDTYIFGKGYGQDIIDNWSSASTDIDVLKLKDIRFDEAEILKSAGNLIIKVKGTDDLVTVQGYFYSGTYSLENIEFSDGISMSYDDMKGYVNGTYQIATASIINSVSLINQIYCSTSIEEPISEVVYGNISSENQQVNIFKSDVKIG